MKEIYTVDWKTGGVDYSYGTRTPKTVYNYELGAASSVTTESSQVHLMYLSDYGYAASPEYWTTNLGSYSNATDNNWLFIESSGWPDEWTISRRSDSSSWAWAIDNMGNIEFEATGTNSAIRRCFYLKSDVLYISDDGTQSNPFRIG